MHLLRKWGGAAPAFVVAWLSSVTIAAAQDGSGQLVVVSDPPGARVLVDGREVGVSPASVDGLLPGPHVVVVIDARGQSAQQIAEVTAGRATLVQIAITAPQDPPPHSEAERPAATLDGAAPPSTEPPASAVPPQPEPPAPAPQPQPVLPTRPPTVVPGVVRVPPVEAFAHSAFSTVFGYEISGIQIFADTQFWLRMHRLRVELQGRGFAFSLGAAYADMDLAYTGALMGGTMGFGIPAIGLTVEGFALRPVLIARATFVGQVAGADRGFSPTIDFAFTLEAEVGMRVVWAITRSFGVTFGVSVTGGLYVFDPANSSSSAEGWGGVGGLFIVGVEV